MPNLEDLGLSGNRISVWDPTVLAANTQLRRLQLTQNLISTINPRSFENLTNLEALYLGRLIEEQVPAFENLGKLQVLYLFSNKITNVSSESFSGMTNIQELNLDWNRVELVNFTMNESDRMLQSLRILSLQWNKISSLQENAFSMLIA